MSVLEQLVEKPQPPKPVSPVMREDGDHVDVVPYNAYQDPQCAHYFLNWFWDRMRENGLLKLYYPDLTDDDRLFPTFVRMLSSDSTRVVLVVLRDDEGKVKDVIGLSTWEYLKLGPSTVGHCGFIFREAYWNRRTSIEAGHRIMEHWFEEAEPKLDVAIGMIARENHLARRYVSALGWKENGFIHNGHQYDGKTCDAVLYQYTREQHQAKEGK